LTETFRQVWAEDVRMRAIVTVRRTEKDDLAEGQGDENHLVQLSRP
jgi:hypothetical protein